MQNMSINLNIITLLCINVKSSYDATSLNLISKQVQFAKSPSRHNSKVRTSPNWKVVPQVMFSPQKKNMENERLLVLHKLKCVVSCGQPCSSCLHTSLKSNLTWMPCKHSLNELTFQSHQLGLTYVKKHDGLHHFFMCFLSPPSKGHADFNCSAGGRRERVHKMPTCRADVGCNKSSFSFWRRNVESETDESWITLIAWNHPAYLQRNTLSCCFLLLNSLLFFLKKPAAVQPWGFPVSLMKFAAFHSRVHLIQKDRLISVVLGGQNAWTVMTLSKTQSKISIETRCFGKPKKAFHLNLVFWDH